MILRQFPHTDPAALSYLLGCGGKATGAVVDAVGDVEPYLRAAEATGLAISYVIDTHLHADHPSAGRRLAFARPKALPDHVEVLPGAYSGPVCGRRLSGKPSSSTGFERRHNGAFRVDDEDAFVRTMLADIPEPPAGAANAGLAAAA